MNGAPDIYQARFKVDVVPFKSQYLASAESAEYGKLEEGFVLYRCVRLLKYVEKLLSLLNAEHGMLFLRYLRQRRILAGILFDHLDVYSVIKDR